MISTVRAKLIAGFGLLVFAIVSLGVLNWLHGLRVSAATKALYARGVLVTRALGGADATLHHVQSNTINHVAATSERERRVLEQELASLDQLFLQDLEEARKATVDATRQAAIDELRRHFFRWVKQRDEEILPASRAGQRERALALITTDARQMFDASNALLQDLIEQQVEDSRRVRTEADDAVLVAAWVGIVGAAFTALFGLAIASVLSRSISTRLDALAAMTRALGDGHLRHRADLRGEDEIADLARSFNQMADTLESLVERQRAERDTLARTLSGYGAFVERIASGDLTVSQVEIGEGELAELGRNLSSMSQTLRAMTLRIHEAVVALSTASAEIQATTQQHSASASESASAVAETVASVDEVAQSAQSVADTAQGVQETSRRSMEVTAAGKLAVRRSTEAMHAVRGQVQSIAQRILALSEEAQEVGQIVATVNELAEQSNVLSLNASIEAARAGEHGRGFAVVAQEIRALAEQSRHATALVRDMLSNIQKSTSKAVLATEEGTKIVTQAVETVGAAGERIEQLAEVIEGAATSAERIRSGALQQVQGVTQISQAMRSIDDSARQAVAGTRNIEQAARELNGVSARLQQAAAQYRT